MPKCGHSRIEFQVVREKLFDRFAGDLVKFPVNGTFGNNNYRRSFTHLTVLCNNYSHFFLPIRWWWVFRDKEKICTSADACHEGKPSTMPAHNLYYESSL